MVLGSASRLKRDYRPALECLEGRDCPAAPAVMTFAWEYTQQQRFLLQGTVTDEQPAGLTVVFSGVYNGSVTTDANGQFSLIVEPTGLGQVNASVTDGEGLTSAPAGAWLNSMPPTINNFTAVRQLNNIWVFSGSVMDEYAPGLKVYFGGLPSLANKWASVSANGTFSLTVDLAQGEQGTATAVTCDWWGLSSNEATALVFPSA